MSRGVLPTWCRWRPPQTLGRRAEFSVAHQSCLRTHPYQGADGVEQGHEQKNHDHRRPTIPVNGISPRARPAAAVARIPKRTAPGFPRTCSPTVKTSPPNARSVEGAPRCPRRTSVPGAATISPASLSPMNATKNPIPVAIASLSELGNRLEDPLPNAKRAEPEEQNARGEYCGQRRAPTGRGPRHRPGCKRRRRRNSHPCRSPGRPDSWPTVPSEPSPLRLKRRSRPSPRQSPFPRWIALQVARKSRKPLQER